MFLRGIANDLRQTALRDTPFSKCKENLEVNANNNIN